MGEVKRWECAGEDLPRECQQGPCVDYVDYASLERERDGLKARNAECEAAVDQAVALGEYIESAAKGAMVERIKTALSSRFAQERAAELTRLRAVEVAAKVALPTFCELHDMYQRAADYAGEGCFGIDDELREQAENAIKSLDEAFGSRW